MVSISRSMSSRCLSTELVDGATALRFGEAFEGRHVELVFDLVGGDAVLLCEVEEVFDLLGGRRSIRGRAVPLTVIILLRCRGHLLGVLSVFHREGRRLMRRRISFQFGLHAVSELVKGFVDLRIDLFRREPVRKFDFHGDMVRLAAVFRVSRNFLCVCGVELKWLFFLSI